MKLLVMPFLRAMACLMFLGGAIDWKILPVDEVGLASIDWKGLLICRLFDETGTMSNFLVAVVEGGCGFL